jgi:membrane protease YdiL (CAAX protease family)
MFASLTGIVQYTRSYYYGVFNRVYFWIIVVILTAIILTNYLVPLTAVSYNSLQHFGLKYCLYFLPYAFAFLLQYPFFRQSTYHKSRWFWLLLLLAPLIFSLRVSFNFPQNINVQTGAENGSHYWPAIFKLLIRSLLLIIPVSIIWWIKDKDKQRLYGFTPLKNLKPFFILLACMVPIVVVAGLLPGFLNTYPVVLKIVGEDVPNRIAASGLFELYYAFDFFSIEFFFRGFLILAFTRICGMHAIIPAAVFYCCIHLGKPMPEAISSFFGALLLGIISYHNKSIWGGLIIHIGIAWLMEIVSLLHSLP